MLRKLPKPLVRNVKGLYQREIKKQRGQLRKAGVKDTRRLELHRIEGFFTRLPIADHRYFTDPEIRNKIDSRLEAGPMQDKRYLTKGNQVRFLNVSRRYPKIGRIVIKRDDNNPSGHLTLTQLKKIVQKHNKEHQEKTNNYLLRAPTAHHIGGLFIAMAEAQYPSLHEILGFGPREKNEKKEDREKIQQTPRGRVLLSELTQNKNISRKQLIEIMETVVKRTGLPPRNIALIGIQKGKPILMPLVDID
jgi:hypothetical protein